MQGTMGLILGPERPIYCGAVKAVRHNYWSLCTLEATWLLLLQSMCSRVHTATMGGPYSPQLEKAHAQQWRPCAVPPPKKKIMAYVWPWNSCTQLDDTDKVIKKGISSVQFGSVTQSCPALCDPMNCSMPGLPVHHHLPEFTQTQRPSSPWCHPTISSWVVLFSSCPQSLPASESFPMSQLFARGGQSTGASALASFLPKKSQGWS